MNIPCESDKCTGHTACQQLLSNISPGFAPRTEITTVEHVPQHKQPHETGHTSAIPPPTKTCSQVQDKRLGMLFRISQQSLHTHHRSPIFTRYEVIYTYLPPTCLILISTGVPRLRDFTHHINPTCYMKSNSCGRCFLHLLCPFSGPTML